MSTVIPESADEPTAEYASRRQATRRGRPFSTRSAGDDSVRRSWMWVALCLVGLVAVIASIVSIVALASAGGDSRAVSAAPAAAAHTDHAAAAKTAAAPTVADAKGVAFEPFERVDPTLPAVPPGAGQEFKVDVFQHVTQVSKALAPTEVWSSRSTASTTAGPASPGRWW